MDNSPLTHDARYKDFIFISLNATNFNILTPFKHYCWRFFNSFNNESFGSRKFGSNNNL